MEKLFALAIAFGIIMAVYHEIKGYRWEKANPLRVANFDWKNNS